MITLNLITAPVEKPLLLDDVKQHLRVTHTRDDDLINRYIDSATSLAEKFMGRALMTQTWEMLVDAFPTTGNKWIKIPLSPIQAISSVKYDDLSNVEQTLSTSNYFVDIRSEPARLAPYVGGWPTAYDGIGNIRIRFIAGYAASTDSPVDNRANIPAGIKQGLLLAIGSFYEHREDEVIGQSVARLSVNSEHVLRPFRVTVAIA